MALVALTLEPYGDSKVVERCGTSVWRVPRPDRLPTKVSVPSKEPMDRPESRWGPKCEQLLYAAMPVEPFGDSKVVERCGTNV